MDELLITSKSTQPVVGELSKKIKFKLTCAGPISYHLGYDFTRDASN